MHARRIAAISSALVSLVVLVANTAFAGIGGSFVPTDPAGTLHVGQAFSASLTLTNTSDGSSISETINVVGGILLTPSCAAKSGINCTGPDPGVFALSSPIGAPGTSCANVTFTLGPPDPGTGEVQFISGSTLKLGPADGSGGASNPPFCRIVFNAVVLKLPQDSDAQAPGVQTFQLADALLQSTTNLALTAPATGVSQTRILPNVDLFITKTDGVLTVNAGGSTTYTVTVTNNGPNSVTGATLIDPSTLPNLIKTAVACASNPGKCVSAPSIGQLESGFPLPLLNSGDSYAITVTATVLGSATGQVTNTATVTPPSGTFSPGTGCTVISPPSKNPRSFNAATGACTASDIDDIALVTDLLISKTDGKTTAIPGTSDTYTIVVTNFGPSVATGATVGDTFPAIFTGVTYTASATGSATGFTASGSGNIADTVTMPVGSTITYIVSGTISATATGTLTNSATVALASNIGTHCTAASPGTAANPVAFTVATGTCTATDIDQLSPQTDLLISKTDGKTTAVPGTSDTYTIVVTNFGPSVAVNAAVGDTFPAIFTGVTYTASATGSASGFTASGSGNIADTVTMPVGSTITYIVTGTISATATGTLTNSATVALASNIGTHCTAASPGPAANPVAFTAASGTCTATDIDQLSPVTDLLISKTDGKTTAVPGTSDTYTIVVTNFGPSVAVNAAVGDTFPAIFTGVTYTASATGSATGFTASGSGNIADTVTMPVGSTITYIVSGTISANATGTLSNSATVSLSNNVGTHCTAASPGTAANPVAFTVATGTCTATDIDTLGPQTDLLISKTDGKTTAIPGTSDTYTIVVTNFGPSVAVGAAVGDTFPAIFTGVTYTASATGSATGFTASGSGNIADTVTMPVGSTITYIVSGTISASATGTLSNSATVALSNNTGTHCTAASPGPAANPVSFTAASGTCTATDIDQLSPQTDLLISKTDGKTTAVPGTSDTYTIVVTNFGPSVAVNAAVGDTFPAIFTGVTYTASATGSASGFTASGSGNIADTVTMPVGSTITYIVTGTISATATGTLTNSATVALVSNIGTHCAAASPGTAANPVSYTAASGTCTATDIDSVTPVADLSISKTDGKTTVDSQTTTTYTLVVSNGGPAAAVNAILTDPQASGLSKSGTVTCGSATAGAVCPTVGAAAGQLSYANLEGAGVLIPSMPSGSSLRFTVTATVTAVGGSVTNSASIAPPAGTINTGTSCTTQSSPNARSFSSGVCTASDTDTVPPQPCFLGNPATHQLYPYGSGKTATAFNESEVLAAHEPDIATAGGSIRMFYVDEHAMLLGISSVNGTPYALTTFVPGSPAGSPANAGSASNPATGATVAQGGKDSAGRPIAPSLFCTDITNNPNDISGDWQQGGTGVSPDFVSGTWKGATFNNGSFTSDGNPSLENATKPGGCTLGAGADTPPNLGQAGSNKFCAEVRWSVDTLLCNGAALQPNHVYRVQFMVHDGDQNNGGGDVGEACAIIAR